MIQDSLKGLWNGHLARSRYFRDRQDGAYHLYSSRPSAMPKGDAEGKERFKTWYS